MTRVTKSLGAFGVEIEGLDLCGAIGDADLAWLRETIVDEGFVLLRDQPIGVDAQVALGQRFGPIEQLDSKATDEEPTMVVIGNVASDGTVLPSDNHYMMLITINEGWHTDSSFREIPASFSIFSCVVAPEEGGDTFYANQRVAWETLDPSLRERLRGLEGVHDYNAAYRRRGNEIGGIVGFDTECLRHPLVRAHPESGRTSLYVSEHIASIEGLPESESRALLNELLAHATAPARVYRHHWRVGDLAIWDNRTMLHKAQGFDERYARVMHHVRVAGFEKPIPATF